MFEVKVKKDVAVNEQGTAETRAVVTFKNKSSKPQPLPRFGFSGSALDMVNINVRHGEMSLPYVKVVKEEGIVGIGVDSEGVKLDANQTYSFTIRCTIPSLVGRFDRSYFCKEVYTHILEEAETCEWDVTYKLPMLFSRKEFWKEMRIDAPQASEFDTQWEHKFVKYQFVLKRGSHREISFMFQERYNSKVLALLTFLLGIGFIQFFDWLVSLIF